MLVRFWRWLGFHVHDWDKWELVDMTLKKIVNEDYPWQAKLVKLDVTRQHRRCKTCGKYQMRVW